MIERRVVRRYASALFRAASAAGEVDRIESDLGLITYVLESSPRLMSAMWSPIVTAFKKKEIVREIFGDKVHPITLSYLDLLIAKRREAAIVHTEEEYVLLANEARGIVLAEVTTAVELGMEDERRLKAKLDAMTGKSIDLLKSVDPAIIAGVLVKMGDTLIDGSIRGQLEALRTKLQS